MIRKQSGETVTKYFDRFKSSYVNAELSKGNLTKHESLEKSERGYGNTSNPGKVTEKKVFSHVFP